MRQTRYAVVLNGGVSLAIWMGGVTAELNRLRLASESLCGAAVGLQASPAWQEILRVCERSVIVDVLAGTSAGGLNGTLLATAVARGADMPNMGEQWPAVASLKTGRLTRATTDTATSLLDGDYFSRQLTDILAMIEPQRGVSITPRECTLLVTATALDSNPRRLTLKTGRPMYTRDGRRVYKFQRLDGIVSTDPPLNDDFATDGHKPDTLRLAARASASFPAAFAPVPESRALAAHRVDPHQDHPGRWLVDGGVLDNAPFEPLLGVLRERPISERYERVLLYITPGISEENIVEPGHDPLQLIPALKSVISAMREPDARLDADALRDLFEQMGFSKAQAFQTIADYLDAPEKAETQPLLDAASDLFLAYCTTRAEATERWLISLATGDPDAVPLAPPPDATLKPERIPGIPTGSFPDFDNAPWKWGWTTADRILRWWGRAVSAVGPDTTATKDALAAIGAAQRKVFAYEPELDAAVSGTRHDPMGIEDQLAAMTAVYEGLTSVLKDAIRPTAEAIAAALSGADAEMLIKLSLAVEVVSSIFSWSADGYDTPVLQFHNITPAAEPPPGLDLGLNDKQRRDWPSKKLYGERLGHFGAFVSEEGRRHDWLWGRLDGATELSKRMLAETSLSPTRKRQLQTDLIAEILKEEGTSNAAIAADVAKVYGATTDTMIHEMAASDGGDAFRHLESTVWALSRQWALPGGWIRALLAPQWSITKEWSTAKEAGIPRKWLPVMKAVRLPTTPIRRFLRSKLPYRHDD